MACSISGCHRPLTDPPLAAVIRYEGVESTLTLCKFHKSMFNNVTPDIFGRRYIGEVEIITKQEDPVMSSVPTMFSINLSGSISLNETPVSIPFAASEEWPIHDGEFEVVDDKISVLIPGIYQIDAFFKGRVGGSGSMVAGGPVSHQVGIGVNGETKGPAYNFYPTETFEVVMGEVTAQEGESSWSFAQDLDAGDVVEMMASFKQLGDTDMGTFEYRPFLAYITFTKIG